MKFSLIGVIVAMLALVETTKVRAGNCYAGQQLTFVQPQQLQLQPQPLIPVQSQFDPQAFVQPQPQLGYIQPQLQPQPQPQLSFVQPYAFVQPQIQPLIIRQYVQTQAFVQPQHHNHHQAQFNFVQPQPHRHFVQPQRQSFVQPQFQPQRQNFVANQGADVNIRSTGVARLLGLGGPDVTIRNGGAGGVSVRPTGLGRLLGTAGQQINVR